jgi:hypothetical protein
VYYLGMTNLVKGFGRKILNIYSIITTIPAELGLLNAWQKVWLILASPVILIGVFLCFFSGLINVIESTTSLIDILFIQVAILGISFGMPFVVYWVIDSLVALGIWVKK